MHCFVFLCPMSNMEHQSMNGVRGLRTMMMMRKRWRVSERFGYYSITGIIVASQPASLFHCLFWSTIERIYTRSLARSRMKSGGEGRIHERSGGEPRIFASPPTSVTHAHSPIHLFYLPTLRHHLCELRVRWTNESVYLSNKPDETSKTG